MADDDAHAQRLSAEECREHAKRIRRAAQDITDAVVRQQILDIADQYDQLADGIGRARLGSD